MKLVLIRHAIAEERDLWAKKNESDTRRPLTNKGRQRMTLQARGLKRIVPKVDIVLSSPLARATETAEIVLKEYKEAQFIECAALEPSGNVKQLLDTLCQHSESSTVMLVGHEPDMSELISVLVLGTSTAFTHLKKGSATMVEFDGKPSPSKGLLRWSIAPSALRELSKLS